MPLLSIIIPTRNRPNYLLTAVRVIQKNCIETEIIISDNSDTPILAEHLRGEISAGVVKYSHYAERLDIVSNFERSLLCATGDYVLMIGDDDSIGPGIVEVARWARDCGVDSVASYGSRWVASYFWPGVRSKYFGDSLASKLFIYPMTGAARSIDASASIRRVAANFGGNLDDLPRVYHGLASRMLLERIKGRFGSLFGGLSPDIFSAVLIATEAKKAMLVDYPFVIPGASPPSAAGSGVARSDKGELQSFDHIARFENRLKWDNRIPAFYSPMIVWALTLQMALDRIPNNTVTPNYPKLFARCLLFHWPYRSPTFRAIRIWRGKRSSLYAFALVSIAVIGEVFSQSWRIINRLRHPRAGGNSVSIAGLDSIEEAYYALAKHLSLNGPIPDFRTDASGACRAPNQKRPK